MKTIYCLVYQGGIANVFHDVPNKTRNLISRVRVLQHSFIACEWFCRGLRQAGEQVDVAWCNEAGDIKESFWEFSNFDNAPFCDKFAKDFVKKK